MMRSAFILLSAVVLILCTGCRETVDSRLDIEGPFSLYGIMNPKTDTHAVRIFEVQSNIMLVRPEPIDAVVTTLRLDTGEEQAWQDSVVQLDDGDFRHVYWAHFRVRPGESYRLDVVRSDGARSSAITTVPPPVTLEVLEPDVLRPSQALMPVFIHGRPPALPRINVEYILVGFAEEGSAPVFKPLLFNYAGEAEPQPGGYLLEINLREDYSEIFRAFDRDNDVTTDIIDLRQINVTVHVGDNKWVSPVGFFDEEFLVEPGSFSNVDNGFGFFGSGYTESISFRPPVDLLRRAGFYIAGENGSGR